ncbi:hypothetical protein PPTG_13790 [Phytophthora nicotianae INRA-310]|uniref:BED-type domain-containing protein n=1 Tax=Phytophthora nicotianae (strain INRA-310) TaxID=761204 RepID=W2PYC4_PHYN3|nr:hypothetical protein PPTG_13790 [Phytophthora nicotianae INRA-310]ETN05938.1 hypothetical protein PPTG_13790 [Phytophthora nicotianae INRA-310]
MSTTRNSDLSRFFFAADTDRYFVCNYCSARHKQIPSSGYANMISHFKDKHPGYVEDYKSHQSRQAGLHRTFGFVNPTASNMYRWIEWVVARNMPLSEVDDPFTRGMSKLQPVCSKTLKRYMTLLVAAVEAKITAEMSGQYGYMYDASTFYLENYVDNIKHSVTLKLQLEDVMLADVRALFDSIIERFPTTKAKLSATATIVHFPTFEAAAVKVNNGEVGSLTASERKAIKRFEVETASASSGRKRKRRDDDEKEEDFATSVLRAKKASGRQTSASYSKLIEKLPPTNNHYESLLPVQASTDAATSIFVACEL